MLRGLPHPAAIAQQGQTGAIFCILKKTGLGNKTLYLLVMRSRAITCHFDRKEPLQNNRLSCPSAQSSSPFDLLCTHTIFQCHFSLPFCHCISTRMCVVWDSFLCIWTHVRKSDFLHCHCGNVCRSPTRRVHQHSMCWDIHSRPSKNNGSQNSVHRVWSFCILSSKVISLPARMRA